MSEWVRDRCHPTKSPFVQYMHKVASIAVPNGPSTSRKAKLSQLDLVIITIDWWWSSIHYSPDYHLPPDDDDKHCFALEYKRGKFIIPKNKQIHYSTLACIGSRNFLTSLVCGLLTCWRSGFAAFTFCSSLPSPSMLIPPMAPFEGIWCFACYIQLEHF